MRLLSLTLTFIIGSMSFPSFGWNGEDWFPTTPNEKLTPGTLCLKADTFRYPERVAYCERAVSKERKAEIFRAYDRELGFHTQEMNRMDFKIDHYIPLCMGGSNDEENLWPQHKSIYALTDPIEEPLCQLMASGRMMQAKAIEIVRRVKRNPKEAEKVVRELRSQLD